MPDWLTKDFHWKAFSLLMAIGIWLTISRPSGTAAVQAADRVQQPYDNVPVLPISADGNVRPAQITPQMVTVTISGTREILDQIKPSEIHAFVNLTGLASAENLPKDVEVALPEGVVYVNIDPPQVAVTLPKQP